jgi:hypothetical protein
MGAPNVLSATKETTFKETLASNNAELELSSKMKYLKPVTPANHHVRLVAYQPLYATVAYKLCQRD